MKTTRLDFHDIDLCWAVYRVDLDDDGNPIDPVIIDCSEKYQKEMKIGNVIGKKHSEISHGTNQLFVKQCYEAAYNKKFIRDHLVVPYYGNWISYTLSQADEEGKCIFTFCQLEDLEAKAIKHEKAWKTSELAITCAKILRGKEDFSKSVPKVLDILSNAIMPDRLYLLIVNGDVANVMFEWRRSLTIYSAHDLFDGYSLEQLLEWQKNLRAENEIVILRDISSLDGSANGSIAMMQKHDLETIIFIPMRYGDKLIGFFVADNFENSQTLDIRELMETVSFFIVSEFVNGKLMDDLKTDILTHVLSRNAFDAKVSELEASAVSLGVVYADVNGLKAVNDSQGHEAGDTLIKRAADCLTSVFRKSEVYRLGGDEFVVLQAGIPQDAFAARYRIFEGLLNSRADISMAIGSSWTDNSRDVQVAMKIADENMYADKQHHYDKTNKSIQ